jgi:hypothetical protein
MAFFVLWSVCMSAVEGNAMRGPIHEFLSRDHEQLEALLDFSTVAPGEAVSPDFEKFRAGLLKHIAMEERILIPAVEEAAGEPLAIAARLRLDHGALAALLVPMPTPTIVRAIRCILAGHNLLEEGPGGLYETCEHLLGSDGTAVLARLRAAPEVHPAEHNEDPLVLAATRRALERAGYCFDAYARPSAPAVPI